MPDSTIKHQGRPQLAPTGRANRQSLRVISVLVTNALILAFEVVSKSLLWLSRGRADCRQIG
jgi:hypothetical protein